MRASHKSRRRRWLKALSAALPVLAVMRGHGADTSGQTDPLLDLFIKKGFVTQEEAERVKAEADYMRTNGAANAMPSVSKWKISDAIKSVQLFGDLRMRYEDRSVRDPGNGQIDLERLRFALRFGLRGDLRDDFYYGLRLETASNPRSPWVTMGQSASGVPYQGPFGKSNDGLNVGQAYIGWRLNDWAEITLGQMPNPLYTTPMVWDNDINPAGAAEHFKYTVGQADFFANFGQFIYQQSIANKATVDYFIASTPDVNTAGASSTFLLAWQGGVTYHVTRQASFKVAPAIYVYTLNGTDVSSGTPGFPDTFVGQGSLLPGVAGFDQYPNGYYDGFGANQTGINNLEVLEIPFEVNYKLDSVNLRLFGDYAYNFDGAARAQAAYDVALAENNPNFTLPDGQVIPYPTAKISSPQTHDVSAYQIGIGAGSANIVDGPMQGLVYGTGAHKHDWEVRTYWQHVEQYALDPNLIDSDFFEGRGNLQGVYVAVAYALADNVIATFRYGYASRINSQLGTGGSNQDIPQMNPIDHYNLLQVDATIMF